MYFKLDDLVNAKRFLKVSLTLLHSDLPHASWLSGGVDFKISQENFVKLTSKRSYAKYILPKNMIFSNRCYATDLLRKYSVAKDNLPKDTFPDEIFPEDNLPKDTVPKKRKLSTKDILPKNILPDPEKHYVTRFQQMLREIYFPQLFYKKTSVVQKIFCGPKTLRKIFCQKT